MTALRAARLKSTVAARFVLDLRKLLPGILQQLILGVGQNESTSGPNRRFHVRFSNLFKLALVAVAISASYFHPIIARGQDAPGVPAADQTQRESVPPQETNTLATQTETSQSNAESIPVERKSEVADDTTITWESVISLRSRSISRPRSFSDSTTTSTQRGRTKIPPLTLAQTPI